MDLLTEMRPIATLCGPGCCPACPQIFAEEGAEQGKQVVITDDFGGTIRMSKDQLRSFVDQAKAGAIVV